MSLFSLLYLVWIGHYNCQKVERCNCIDYIMNRLSITSHCYTCDNWIVKYLTARIMTCLRTNVRFNDLIRGNTLFIIHTQTILYALYVLRIKGRKDSFLCRVDIIVLMITRHVLLLCFVCVLITSHSLVYSHVAYPWTNISLINLVKFSEI